MQILMDAERSAVQYGMSFEAKPDDDYKKAILEAANISLNNRRDGKPGIDLATHTYILERVMQGGNLKELRLIIAYQEGKAREEIDKQNKENIELQGQQNAQLEQMKAQAEQQKQQFEMQKEYVGIWKDVINSYYSAYPEQAQKYVQQIETLMGIQNTPNLPSTNANIERSPREGSPVPLE